tara:strand:+ start:350 stop:469 length:120 start_codon:yes stop_codon:yes gene_type:complete
VNMSKKSLNEDSKIIVHSSLKKGTGLEEERMECKHTIDK